MSFEGKIREEKYKDNEKICPHGTYIGRGP